MEALYWLLSGMVLAYIFIPMALYFLKPREPSSEDLQRQKIAAVVVVGDLGHSPRMCFHALSILQCGWKVKLVGYLESNLMEELKDHPELEVVELPRIQRGGSYFLYVLKRVLFDHYQLYKALAKLGKLDVLLVQTPPAIPTLGAARLFTLFKQRECKLIIDWHNLGYTILALHVKSKPAVVLYRCYEALAGHVAYLHTCVSVRLGVALRFNMAINPKRVIPLHDRPLKGHCIESKLERLELREKFGELGKLKDRNWVVTSTSYTPDEDLELLLQAASLYDRSKKEPLCIIVTGKGPLKEEFCARVAECKLQRVSVHTLWLEYHEYHELLAVCDLGVSLHKSSSGFDLPMKVVDMFGAGVPVAALDFPALNELVNEKNGLVFKDASGLCTCLGLIGTSAFSRLRSAAIKESQKTWFELWKTKLGPVFGYGIYSGLAEDTSSSSEDPFENMNKMHFMHSAAH